MNTDETVPDKYPHLTRISKTLEELKNNPQKDDNVILCQGCKQPKDEDEGRWGFCSDCLGDEW